MQNRLNNINIILSHTSHPGNIGSTARAMKTMGLSNLILINPKIYPSEQATAMSAGADDILSQAQVSDSLDNSIADAKLVIGTSARDRSLPWSMLNPKQCAEKIIEHAAIGQVALLFGCEKFGLTNEELQKCHYHVQIPANPEYSSLNLAMAVQVLCYEIRVAALTADANEQKNLKADTNIDRYATHQELEYFYEHLEKVLKRIQFIKPPHPNRIMQRLRRLFSRARLEETEINILRGILSEIEKNVE